MNITKSQILNSIKKVSFNGFNTNNLTLDSIEILDSKDKNFNFKLSINDGINPQALKEKIRLQLFKDFPEAENFEIDIISSVSQSNIFSKTAQKVNAILPGVKNTIAVASGKGGVGKSTVAVNLAVALAKDGAKVGLIDADIYGPSIPLMLGVNERPKVFQTENGVKMIPLEKYGVKFISIGLLVDDTAPIIWRGPMASGAIKQFMSDVEWGELDYLIFDLPPGTGDIQLTLVQTIPLSGAVIVTTPQEVSLIDARKALMMFNRVNVPVLGVVENMSYFIAPDTGKRYDIFGSGGGEKICKELSVELLGGIPIDPRIRVGGDNGVPMVYDLPDTEYSNIMMEISRNLLKQVNIRNSEQSDKIEIIFDEN
jgi:ATP-binding protein involved in chromosome partitioning